MCAVVTCDLKMHSFIFIQDLRIACKTTHRMVSNWSSCDVVLWLRLQNIEYTAGKWSQLEAVLILRGVFTVV